MYQGELKQPVIRLQGIGPKTSSALSAAGIITISDILKHYPRTYEDRKRITGLAPGLRSPEPVMLNTPATVTGHEFFGWGKKKTLKVIIEDGSGIQGALICFNRDYLADKMKIGSTIIVYGSFQNRYNELQSSSFEYELLENDFGTMEDLLKNDLSAVSAEFGRILPVYPLTSGLSQRILRRAVEHALKEWAVNVETEIPDSGPRRSRPFYKAGSP